jgi:hypothetical protein
VAQLGLVLRYGFLFGLISGAFAVMVRLVAVFATNDVAPTALSDFVNSALSLLIIGGAGRTLAARTRTTTIAVQVGAIAGGISELMRTVVAGYIIFYLPQGRDALAHLSPAARRQNADVGTQIITLGLDLAVAIAFGALIGWLGAWSMLRLGPPREPPNGRV